MRVVPCPAPAVPLDPAPLTSLALSLETGAEACAFWAGDEYVVRQGDAWFRIDAEPLAPSGTPESRQAAAELALAIIPLGPGRVAFPVGSSGRTVYRVWRATGAARSGAAARSGRIRILGARAGRSLRQPA